MSFLKSIWDHPFTFWAILSVPALLMTMGLASGDPEIIGKLVHPTGEFAARMMIIGMMISPLILIFRNARWLRWMMKRRRYLGVAAFFYALAHTAFYLIDEGAVAFTGGELSKLYIWTGWFAFLIFVPLAVTSTDGWMRKLGRNWKTLQRTTYGAAVLTLLHWAALHDWGGVGPALVHFLPLALLETYRIWYWYLRPRQRAVPQT